MYLCIACISLLKESIYTEGLNLDTYIIKHFKDVCVGKASSVQIFLVFPDINARTTKYVQLTVKLG